MKKCLLFSILLVLLASCSKQIQNNNKEVSLELLNREVVYADIDSSSLLNSEARKYDELKVYSEKERASAYNVLSFKITNNSNKKYYFALNPDEFSFLGSSVPFKRYCDGDSISRTSVCYLIDNEISVNNNITTTSWDLYTKEDDSLGKKYFNKYLSIMKNIRKDDDIPMNRKNHQDFGDNPFINSTFVLHPGEYKIFKRKIYLPIDVEKDHNFKLKFNALIIPPNLNYNFCLAISAKKKFIWNSLYDYQKKEIMDNGYEIFDGTILSNKVPLKIKK